MGAVVSEQELAVGDDIEIKGTGECVELVVKGIVAAVRISGRWYDGDGNLPLAGSPRIEIRD